VATAANSYLEYQANGHHEIRSPPSTYWTDLSNDGTYNLISARRMQRIRAASTPLRPWVPFNPRRVRRGCHRCCGHGDRDTGVDLQTVFENASSDSLRSQPLRQL